VFHCSSFRALTSQPGLKIGDSISISEFTG
jgi:hypothetical protein